MKKRDLQILQKRVINYQNTLKAFQDPKGQFVFSGEGSEYDDNSDYTMATKRINVKKGKQKFI